MDMFNAGKKFILLLFFVIYLCYWLSFIQFDSREMLPVCVWNQADCAKIVECPNMEYVSTNRDNFTGNLKHRSSQSNERYLH